MIKTLTYWLRFAVVLLIFVNESHLVMAQSQQSRAKVASDQNKALVQRWIDDGFNKQDVAIVDQIFVEDLTINEAVTHRENLKQSMRRWFTAFPDLHVTIDRLICDGDAMGLWYTAEGTQRGEFEGISVTGRQVKWRGVDFLRIKDGKIAEGRFLDDSLGLLRQLGVTLSLPPRSNKP